ncbi:putative RNA polymerase Rpc34, winged helix-like DNA-binding domain superfamily [Septoria linicola]|nr:putative RNA polymerase Rpc34, winged helix-like DNA-binding domain superfamily [Septoria linicola]
MATPMLDKKEKEELSLSPVARASEELYKVIMSQSQDDNGSFTVTFTQEQLLEHAPPSIADKKELLPIIRYLTSQSLFRTLNTKEKGLSWSIRPREAAKAIRGLDKDEKMIYEIIEASHNTGIWIKSIKNKMNGLAQAVVQKVVKNLESQRLIKPVRSVKAPAQRVYMLQHLVPSEDVTGNSFFDAGDLDESFRDELLNLIIFYVKSNSWVEAERTKKKSHKSSKKDSSAAKEDAILIEDTNDSSAGQKRKRPTDIEDLAVKPHQYRRTHNFSEADFPQLMHRAGIHHYPTAEDIHSFIITSDALTATKSASLTVPEVQGCLDVLGWDDRLEKIWNPSDGTWGYRTKRGVTFRPPGQSYDIEEEAVGTGLTQTPCGRCPVFEVCKEGGPINPQSCVYFDQWLQT